MVICLPLGLVLVFGVRVKFQLVLVLMLVLELMLVWGVSVSFRDHLCLRGDMPPTGVRLVSGVRVRVRVSVSVGV